MKHSLCERGMVIIEASIVFPVMFLAIFFMVFMGNAYFQKCRVEAIVTELVLDGAAYSADPLLNGVDLNGTAPDFVNEYPTWRYYRYFTNMSEASDAIKDELETRLGNVTTGLFSDMKPGVSRISVQAENYVIYSTFSIDADCSIPIPIKMLGAKYFSAMRVSARAEAPVTDVPEFIRNVNMVEDYMEQTGLMEKINNAIKSAKDHFKK